MTKRVLPLRQPVLEVFLDVHRHVVAAPYSRNVFYRIASGSLYAMSVDRRGEEREKKNKEFLISQTERKPESAVYKCKDICNTQKSNCKE
ncbi:hypothetical protein EVAR_38154_1 [Eumeta japonica]|uniref:Uncharacterized protein n=1 Tax=Eumeta variegata TaxID=151549 RepID=A0A4C1ZIT3_EUMVA|nr:hypothetical protein EVAR_38154_1 [Eumeta japonica]